MIALVLCVAQLATAAPESWVGEARLDLPGDLSLSQQDGAPSGTSNFIFAPKLMVTLYGQRLQDDPTAPLGLLPFLQHPGQLEVDVTDTLQPTDDRGDSFAGNVTGTIYPWSSVGLIAGTSVSAAGVAGSLKTTFTLGMVDYVNGRSRLQLEWEGSQSKTGHSFSTASSGAVTNLVSDDASSNRGRAIISWAPESNGWLFTGFAELGWSRSSEVTASNLQSLATSDSRGPFYAVSLTGTAYVGRSLFLGMTLGVHGSGNTFDTSSGNIISNGNLIPWANPFIGYFLTDGIYSRIAYELDYNRAWNDSGSGNNTLSHTITFTLAARW